MKAGGPAAASAGGDDWHVVVIGGGISGLTVAHALRAVDSPPRVTVLESSAVVGGKLRTSELDGLPIDEGAESVLARRPEAVGLMRAVGLDEDVVEPATTSASVWSRGALRAIPAGTVMGVPSDLRALAASGVLSWRALARIPLDHVLPRSSVHGDDVAIGGYVRRRLGREVSERLVEPLLGGVYAGHAEELSLRATVPALAAAVPGNRSLLAAATSVRTAGAVAAGSGPTPAVFASVRGGLGRLPAVVAAAAVATIRTDTTVRELRRTPDGWALVVGSAAAPEVIEADAVVVAVPAAPAARLLDPLAPYASAALRSIPYASVAVASFVYPAHAFPQVPPGSGFLVPPVENRLVKAATLLGSKWHWLGELAGERVVVRASVGRYGEEGVLQRETADLLAAAEADFAAMAGAVCKPYASRLSRWGGGLPQYLVGHVDVVARARSNAERLPGLVVCGAAYDGIGVAACVAGAQAAVARLVAWHATADNGRHERAPAD